MRASFARDATGVGGFTFERSNPGSPVQGGGGLPFAAPQRQILVVGGTRAWNETMLPGGPATPAIGQEKDRAAQIWMLPQGVVKAARMAGEKLVVGMEGNKLTLTFPLPEPASSYTERVRLDERKLVEHVEVMVDNPVLGPALLEADYDNYKDPDLSDIPFPFHIVQKFRGSPILDITLTGARMYNPYVVVPTPDNVEQAYAANAADPQSTVEMQKAGPGVWFITGASHNSLAIEFKDYVALIESPVGENRAAPLFDAVKKQFPNKKIRYVINTHHHFDHAGGHRHVVAEGTTILTYRDNPRDPRDPRRGTGDRSPALARWTFCRLPGWSADALAPLCQAGQRRPGQPAHRRHAAARALQNPGEQSRGHDADCVSAEREAAGRG